MIQVYMAQNILEEIILLNIKIQNHHNISLCEEHERYWKDTRGVLQIRKIKKLNGGYYTDIFKWFEPQRRDNIELIAMPIIKCSTGCFKRVLLLRAFLGNPSTKFDKRTEYVKSEPYL